MDTSRPASDRVRPLKEIRSTERMRWRRRIRWSGSFLAIVAVALAGFIWRTTRTDPTARLAEARRLAELSRDAGAERLSQRQLLLAVEAWRSARSAKAPIFTEVEQALGEAVRSVPAHVVLSGHRDDVLFAAVSQDGRRVVTASKDTTARVWNMDGSGDPIVLDGHDDQVFSAAFSPDGKGIVTASRDKTARLWNADGTGEPFPMRWHSDWVRFAAFS